MKLVTYKSRNAQPKVGVYLNDVTIVDMQGAHNAVHKKDCTHFGSMLAFLEGGIEARDLAGETLQRANREALKDCRLSTNDVVLLSPVPQPTGDGLVCC